TYLRREDMRMKVDKHAINASFVSETRVGATGLFRFAHRAPTTLSNVIAPLDGTRPSPINGAGGRTR
ncbi:MAG TPA: hypothetical protein VII61_12700, partial [Ktedonobacteraceae bacterium]